MVGSLATLRGPSSCIASTCPPATTDGVGCVGCITLPARPAVDGGLSDIAIIKVTGCGLNIKSRLPLAGPDSAMSWPARRARMERAVRTTAKRSSSPRLGHDRYISGLPGAHQQAKGLFAIALGQSRRRIPATMGRTLLVEVIPIAASLVRWSAAYACFGSSLSLSSLSFLLEGRGPIWRSRTRPSSARTCVPCRPIGE